MRSILLHVEDDGSLETRLHAALSLARAMRGHVTCLHATPMEAYVAFDTFGGVFVMEKVIEAISARESSLQERVEDILKQQDVKWDYRNATGSTAASILSFASLADIVVTGRRHQDGGRARADTAELGDILVDLNIPMLIPGAEAAVFDPLGKAIIAWNQSHEAANAVRGAVPLLKLAASVEVIRFEEEGDDPVSTKGLLEYLWRHDVRADLRVETIEKEFVAPALIARAKDTTASHIVMGGYGHSRFGELVFGGVTRSMLATPDVNLVIAH